MGQAREAGLQAEVESLRRALAAKVCPGEGEVEPCPHCGKPWWTVQVRCGCTALGTPPDGPSEAESLREALARIHAALGRGDHGPAGNVSCALDAIAELREQAEAPAECHECGVTLGDPWCGKCPWCFADEQMAATRDLRAATGLALADASAALDAALAKARAETAARIMAAANRTAVNEERAHLTALGIRVAAAEAADAIAPGWREETP